MKTLYVIIPVYNTKTYVLRCVESVTAQSYPAVKAILVDDGSTDGSSVLCDEWAKDHPNFQVIHQENGGLSQARNAGLHLAYRTAGRKDYLTFLDSDDFLHPEFGEKMIGLCERLGCGAAQCAYEKGSGECFAKGSTPHIAVETGEDALLGYKLRSLAIAKIYSRAAFEGVWFPKGMWNEDEFTTYRAVYQSGSIVFTDEKLYYYFQREGSIMDSVAKKLKGNLHRWDWLRAYEERIQYFTALGKPDQAMRTREKICSDLILRYSEQMRLPPEERDEDCVSGRYMELYRENCRLVLRRRGIPPKRRLMYTLFRVVPSTAILASRFTPLRK